MNFLLAIVLFGLPSSDTGCVEEVFLIELNHVVKYSADERDVVSVFSQYIFWKACQCKHPDCTGKRIVAWKLAAMKDSEAIRYRPIRIGNHYRLVYTEDGRLRDVSSRLFRETVVQQTVGFTIPRVVVDPERLDLRVHPKDRRVGLRSSR